MNKHILGGVVGISLCLNSIADTVIVPSEYTTTEGNTRESAPLGLNQTRFQQVYDVALLSALNIGDQINGIGFRVATGGSSVPAQTVSTYDISMSMAPLPPGSLSSVFAENRGSDFQTVRNGSLTLNANTFPGGAPLNNFGWITFSTPYIYKGGDLLIEIAYQGFTTGRKASAVWPYGAGLAQAAFGTSYDSTTADDGIYDEAIIMGLSTIPISAVPEPSTSVMFGAASLLLIIRRLRNRQ